MKLQGYMEQASTSEQQFLKKVTEIIDADLHNEQFGVNELANKMGMERSTLHRKVIKSWYILQEQGAKMIYPGHGSAFPISKIMERFNANQIFASKWLILLLSMSIGGKGKIKLLSSMMNQLKHDNDFQAFVKKETNQIPSFMTQKIKTDLGELWEWLPNKSFDYKTNVISNHLPS